MADTTQEALSSDDTSLRSSNGQGEIENSSDSDTEPLESGNPITENNENISTNSDTEPLESIHEESDADSESTIILSHSENEDDNFRREVQGQNLPEPTSSNTRTGKKRIKEKCSAQFEEEKASTSSICEPAPISVKRSYDEMRNDKEEEDQMCPICLDGWTNEGEHRLCSLRCGHLFGKSCIRNWLVKEKKNFCPQCNKKAHSYDIRELFASKLVALDCSEKTKLEKEIEILKEEKRKVEVELEKCRLCAESYKLEVSKLQRELAKFTGKSENNLSNRTYRFHLEKTIAISDGGCRVCVYDTFNKMLLLCHQTKNLLFSGFGVKRVQKIGVDYLSNNYLHLHGKSIRDIRIHPCNPNVILTVAFDKSAKICDLEKQCVVQTFTVDYVLWSCCWDEEDPNFFYVGTGKGTVHVFDVRSPTFPVAELKILGDTSPVVSICYVPNKYLNSIHGGIICCRLNSVVFYQKTEGNQFAQNRFTNLVGPFFFLIFDSVTGHFLVSCRPSASVQNVRHLYCELDGAEQCRPIHVFVGGTVQTSLSRTCFVRFEKETLAAVFQESGNSVELWSTASGQKVSGFHVREAILDLISINIGERVFIATISDSTLRFYEAS